MHLFFYNCAMFWTLIWVQEVRALLRTVWTDNPLDCKSTQEQTGIEKYPWTFNVLFVCLLGLGGDDIYSKKANNASLSHSCFGIKERAAHWSLVLLMASLTVAQPTTT